MTQIVIDQTQFETIIGSLRVISVMLGCILGVLFAINLK